MSAAGYEVVAAPAGDDPDVVSILFDDVYEAAEVLGRMPAGPVIRLRDHPDEATASGTIYRYDREGLVAALSDAQMAEIEAAAELVSAAITKLRGH